MNNDKELLVFHKQRIEKVANFILKNSGWEYLSLENLARIANYSPYHFQKIFKKMKGESPKQYIIRVRLETAAHYLLIYHDKKIAEISIECGFSSPAVFARSFRDRFGFSASEVRSMINNGSFPVLKTGKEEKSSGERHEAKSYALIKVLKVDIRKVNTMSGICVATTKNDSNSIDQCFRDLVNIAERYDLIKDSKKMIGIFTHHVYKAFIPLNLWANIPGDLERTDIRSGKYAVIQLEGTIEDTMIALTNFREHWLPESGYKIADIFGFEILSENPVYKSYEKIKKEFFIPIEPIVFV